MIAPANKFRQGLIWGCRPNVGTGLVFVGPGGTYGGFKPLRQSITDVLIRRNWQLGLDQEIYQRGTALSPLGVTVIDFWDDDECLNWAPPDCCNLSESHGQRSISQPPAWQMVLPRNNNRVSVYLRITAQNSNTNGWSVARAGDTFPTSAIGLHDTSEFMLTLCDHGPLVRNEIWLYDGSVGVTGYQFVEVYF